MLGDAYISVVTLISYPSSVSCGWLGAVANVNNTRIIISVSPINTAEINKA